MHRKLSTVIASLSFLAAVASADEGMWLFTKPPAEELKAKYGFEATPEWLEHLQKSCVRFSTGGSGSFVSADGLALTNHHVGADMLAKLSTAEHDLLAEGFYAKTREDEVRCPDLELDCLWQIEDVTERVTKAGEGLGDAEANAARRKAINEIEAESKASTGLDSEVVTLYQGARYHLYRYKHYTDVRLVFAPEKQAAFFGGDPDNFEYPRFDLDMCLFRVYVDGKPLQPEHFLRWSEAGASDGELVFVGGHPGRTERLFTVDHLRFLRDVRIPNTLNFLWRSEVWLQVFSSRSEEWRRIAEDELFGVQNSRKAYMGIIAGLQDPQFFARKVEGEKELRGKVEAKPEWKAQWGDAWDQIARAEASYREFYQRFAVLGGGGMNLGSELAGIAKDLVRAAAERPKPNAERLREYNEAGLESLQFQLFSPAPIYPDFEKLELESRLSLLAQMLGGEDPLVVAALAGKSPRARAEELVDGTELADVAVRKRLYEGGAKAIEASKDPLIQLVRTLDPVSRELRKRYEDEVQSAERAGYAKIAAARFAVYGEDLYPDATFTLRLAFGRIRGYEQNGERIEPFTQLGGMYERSAERGNEYPFDLPPKWAAAKSALDLSTPFDFVHDCDIIGGNSGSPTVNRAGEVVGLIFDGNIQSLIWDIAYDAQQGRAVSVDSRAMLEALRKVYGAGALADELTGAHSGS